MSERSNLISADRPRQTLRARWVFPVEGAPIEHGIVEVTAGQITAIGAGTGAVTRDLGNAAIIPGLVNAHTHLELSDVEAPLAPARPFTAWLKSVIGHRRGRPADQIAAGPVWCAGARECRRSGTTLAGDIVSNNWSEESNSASGPRQVAFLELLGLSPSQITPQLARAREHLRHGPEGTFPTSAGRPIRALSPHAPYSVNPQLFTGLVSLARESGAPLAMHLAESPAERELIEQGRGEFVEFLTSLGVWQPAVFPRGMQILDYLKELAALSRALVIHGNDLTAREQDFLATCAGASVVYCPRTHAYFGHPRHPWLELLARGVNVAIGTDSRASNPDLSLWKELLFLRQQFPQVAPATLLEIGTIRGARALGQERLTGSLAVGKEADLAIIDLPRGDSTDPCSLLFDPASRVAGVMIGGAWHDCKSDAL
jgi:cytosine/adenosine deaminase-related metal-dependent hydrolase